MQSQLSWPSGFPSGPGTSPDVEPELHQTFLQGTETVFISNKEIFLANDMKRNPHSRISFITYIKKLGVLFIWNKKDIFIKKVATKSKFLLLD